MSESYDYIILGAGCAGLSLLMRILDEPALQSKKILLVDREVKVHNDRTWCFWEMGTGYFDAIVHFKWQQLYVKHYDGEKLLDMGGYAYKMIRGLDFYRYCFERIKQAANVKLLYGEVALIDASAGGLTVNGISYTAGQIFSSVMLTPPVLKPNQFYLLQHFRGWWVETDYDAFDAATADLMNFRTSQQHGCTFIYVLPVTKRRALVEYTLFTEDKLADEEYDAGLESFINDELKLHSYHIAEKENGIIPMTNFVFPEQDGKVTFIGTAGGQTKASTGYTFQFIQRHSAQLVTALAQMQKVPPQPLRFRFYDSVLLRVLAERKLGGADIFYRMFLRNKAWRVLRFLDNQSTLTDELLIMHSTRKHVFMAAAWKEISHE
jgi:lycopene beta-cyclase